MLGFRVWDKEQSKFINTDSFVMSDSGLLAQLVSPGGCYTGPRYIPMQSTGICDYSGKMIFEGDVLNIDVPSEDGPKVMKYIVGNTCMTIVDLSMIGCISLVVFDENTNRFEANIDGDIIGNIYSNPELLEDK